MGFSKEKEFITPEEYLEGESQAEIKSEYYRGECFAMAGGSRYHNKLALRIASRLESHLEGSPCETYMSDLRLNLQKHEHYVYPDVMVICNPEEDYEKEDTAKDAKLIVEVLSPSTESYDRGTKFFHYQSLPSLEEYVLVGQDTARVEVYRRGSDKKEWIYQSFSNLDESFYFSSLQFSCSLRELYQSIPTTT